MRESFAEKIRKLPRAWAELAIERSGILMDSGDSQGLADQKAYTWTRKAMRERGEG